MVFKDWNAGGEWGVEFVVGMLNCVMVSYNTPHGKESTEVRITQNKGKEWENSYKK